MGTLDLVPVIGWVTLVVIPSGLLIRAVLATFETIRYRSTRRKTAASTR